MANVITKENQRKIAQMLLAFIKQSDAKISQRAKGWTESEKDNQAYIPVADAERNAKRAKEEFSFSKVYIPYSYAIMMAEHTYLTSVFLGRSPIFQLEGSNAAGQDDVVMAETVLSYQVTNGQMLVPLYVFLYDLCLYGVSAIGCYWDDETSYITAYADEPVMVEGIPVEGESKQVESIIEVAGYRGGKLYNVKPKDLIIDAKVGFVQFQDGDGIGRRVKLNKSDILANPEYFNKEFLGGSGGYDSGPGGDNPALVETDYHCDALDGQREGGLVQCYEIYFKVVPKEFGLSKNPNKEIWVFTLTNTGLLIGANPAGWYHGKFPMELGTREFDGYTLSSRGIPEIGAPLNNTLNWLINSHMFNVERGLNNEFIFDPSVLNSKDFMDPAPGKRIRVRPEGYGKDVKQAFVQMNSYDVTRTHMQDIKLVEGLFQRIFGISDQMLGALSQGGRKTATEVRSASGFGLNRLKSLSEFLSAQVFGPLTMKLWSNSQQMYTAEDTFSIAKGLTTKTLDQPITVADIAGNFNFAPVDGTIPIDRMAQAMIYKEILMGMQTFPQVAGRYDVASFFAFIAKMAGVKNLDSFVITDAATIQQEAALGNLVVNGGNNGQGGSDSGANGGAPANSPGIQGTPTASAVGPVG